jgi:hypothetical protein
LTFISAITHLLEGEGGPGQNACTCPYIEGYRGIFGAKHATSPQILCPENPLKVPPPPSAVGQVWGVSQALSMQKKNFRVWTFQTCFRPEDSQLLVQSLISCLAIVVRVQQKKSSDLKLQIWVKYSSYVGQVRLRVRVKVRVNTKKQNISTY